MVLVLAAPVYAQLRERNYLGVRVSHVHLLVRDVEVNRRLFTEPGRSVGPRIEWIEGFAPR